MKKIFKIIGIVILTILIGVITYIYFSVPKLPNDSDEIIEGVMNSKIPEFITGKTGYVMNESTKVWYESISPAVPTKGIILLFMGISNDALGWPQSFIDKLVDSELQVIRFDYRGTGLSDWIENWEEQPYSLSDLANDAKIILDSLKIKKVNLLGISLGGMVAQEFAINFPERTSALISLMSSGYIVDKELPPISTDIVFELVKTSLRYGLLPSEKNIVKLHLSSRIILQGTANYDIDVEGITKQVLYNLKKRRGYNPNASSQHHEATYRSGSRYDKLKKLKIPALLIHGTNDPFIPIEHSKKLATIIPNVRTKWIENMGHDIPPYLNDSICQEIFTTINQNKKE